MKKLILYTLAASLLSCSISSQVNAQANTTLSNLVSPTAVNVDLLPASNNSLDLGSLTSLWRKAYFSDDILINGITVGLGAGKDSINTVFGNGALNQNTWGAPNTAFGYQALNANVTGEDNSAFGYRALFSNTNSDANTAVGTASLYFNTTGSENTAIGDQALWQNTTGSYNTAVGLFALGYNTTGNNNTASGYAALGNNTTGHDNTANGYQAMARNTTGSYNAVNGGLALYSNSTGSANTASGYYSLNANTTGSSNTATGDGALYENSTGYENTATGAEALVLNKSGNHNTANGVNALAINSTGSYNTADGFYTLMSNTTGNKNTALGYKADVSADTLNNSTAIGSHATVNASNKVRIGNNSVSSYSCQVDWTVTSDSRIKDNVQENVPGLKFINELRPVTFHYNVEKENKLLNVSDTEKWQGKYGIEKIAFTGFLAQDVDAAAQKIGYDFSGIDKSGKVLGLRYAEFVVPLVKAVQELSQKNDDLQKQIDELKATIASSSINGAEKLQTPKLQTASLDQNSPNPFSQQTVISYFLPPITNSAVVKIFSVQGEELQSINLSGPGNGQITINGNTLQPGIYAYVLIIDGRTIDTKQMILTK